MATSPPAEYIAAAQAAQRKWGLPALASLALAQCQWESGYGKRTPAGSCNPLGIKCRLNASGVPIEPYVAARTGEGGTAGRPDVFVVAPFRKYGSVTEALDAHGKLLATGAPYAAARTRLPDVEAFVRAMAARYATARDYGDKLLATMKAANLYQYDVKG